MFTTKNLFIIAIRNALASLAIIFITTILIFLLAGQIKNISDSVALNRHLKSELEKRTSLFDELNRDAEIIGANDVKIENTFIPSENILGFVNILDDLAEKNNLAQIYHFETPVPASIVAPFPVATISYSNSFETNVLGFSKYLKEFNTLPYFTKIEGFTITSSDPSGWFGNSKITLRGVLYTNAKQ